MTVTLFVEGGTRGSNQHSQLRKSFVTLLGRAGLTSVNVFICGSGSLVITTFCKAPNDVRGNAIMLVDAEGPATGDAWACLQKRHGDHWKKPAGVLDDQLHLMVELMESWLHADRVALAQYFGAGFDASRLHGSERRIEEIAKQDVLSGLARAAKNSTKPYDKERKKAHSAELLGRIDPNKLKQSAPRFAALLKAIEDRIDSNTKRK